MKAVLVTGASRGIGAALVRYLIRHGIHVVGIARDEFSLRMLSMEKLGGGGLFEYVSGCITDHSVIERAANIIASNDLELIGVVLNAGVIEPIQPLSEVSLDSFKYVMDVNFTANLSICQMALPHLRQTHGSIVMVTSGIVEYPAPSMAPYSCSKAALNTFCQVLALEEPGVTVVAVKPGLVDTAMVGILEAQKDMLGAAQKKFIEESERLDPWIPAENIAKILLRGKDYRGLSGKIIDYSTIP